MNSKSLSILACAALTVLSVSCSKEQVGGGVETGVSFSVEVPGAPATKAIGDGLTAKTLYYQVFDDKGNTIKGLGVQNTTLSSKTATVKFQLMKDQTYKFVFWAQTDVDGYYTIDGADGLKKITANYTGKSANDENFDAFYAVEEVTVTGPVTKSVTLKRPFAQINIASSDKVKAGDVEKDVDLTGAVSTFTVKALPSVFAPIAGTFDGAADVEFASAGVPTETLKVNDVVYKYLSMNYVFAPQDGTVYDIEAKFSIKDMADVNFKMSTVPAKANWRTNIVGNVLTSDTDFDITVDPSFDGDTKLDLDNITTKAELLVALATYKSATLKNEVPVESFVSTKNNYTIEIAETGSIVPAPNMRAELSEVLFVAGNTLTLNGDGKVVGPSNSTSGYGSQAILVQGGNVEINGGLTIEGGSGSVANHAVKITNGTAKIYGGYFHAGLDKDGKSSDLIYLNPVWRKTAKLYIYGGTFETEGDSAYLINMYDSSRSRCTVEVYGGTFVGFNPADNTAEGEHTNFVADGYKSVETTYNGKQAWKVEKK